MARSWKQRVIKYLEEAGYRVVDSDLLFEMVMDDMFIPDEVIEQRNASEIARIILEDSLDWYIDEGAIERVGNMGNNPPSRYMVISSLGETWFVGDKRTARNIAKGCPHAKVLKYDKKLGAYTRIEEYARGELIWENPFGG